MPQHPLLAQLAAYSGKTGALSADQITKAVRSLSGPATANPVIARGRGRFGEKRAPLGVLLNPKFQTSGSLTAAPTGTLTQRAADAFASVTGDDAHAHRMADKLSNVSDMVNPLSWASNLGHSARNLADDPSLANAADTALEATNFLPMGKAAGVLANIGLPILKKGARALTKTAATAAEDMVKFRHYGDVRGITETDPTKWGSNKTPGFISREERATMGRAPPRTYIGFDDAEKPYKRETGVGTHEYEGEIPKSHLYDMDGDPDGLNAIGRALPKDQSGRYLYKGRAMDGKALQENLIKDAGYKGYRSNHPSLGAVGALFEPHPVKAARRKAAAHDFQPKNIPSLLEKDDWSILTAHNPMGKQATPEFNAERMAALKADLDAGGHGYTDGVGKYGNHEDVLAVHGITEDQARALGDKYEQDSVLTNKGLLYRDGRVTPATGVNTFDQAPEDFFTELPNGSKFAVDLNFDGTIPAPKALEAPAIIQSRPAPKADWGYEPQYTGLRNRPAPSEVGFEQTHAMTDRKPMTPEDLYGGTLVAGMADRTRAGGVLSSINGKAFDPIEMQGGQDFMRQHDAAGTGALWASAGGPMTSVNNVVKGIDGPAYFTPFTMQGSSGDYSTMMSDAVLGQLHGTTKKARRAFDAVMRKNNPEWAGMENLDNLGVLREQLHKNGGMRTKMAKLMDSAEAIKSGLPDIGATRKAITDPHQLHVPTEAFGNVVGVLNGKKLGHQAMPHGTYESQIGGRYLGSMETPIPANLMFPDMFNETMATSTRDKVAYRLKMGVKTQKADQEWLDNIMPWYEQQRSKGVNWSSPGLPAAHD